MTDLQVDREFERLALDRILHEATRRAERGQKLTSVRLGAEEYRNLLQFLRSEGGERWCARSPWDGLRVFTPIGAVRVSSMLEPGYDFWPEEGE